MKESVENIYRAIALCHGLEKSISEINDEPARNKKKRVRFALANTPAQDRVRRIKKKYRKLRGIGQTGSGLVSTLANLGLQMGSKAINSVLGKNINGQGN